MLKLKPIFVALCSMALLANTSVLAMEEDGVDQEGPRKRIKIGAKNNTNAEPRGRPFAPKLINNSKNIIDLKYETNKFGNEYYSKKFLKNS